MQDSRDINDNKEPRGRRSLILLSCCQTSPKEYVTIGRQQENSTRAYEHPSKPWRDTVLDQGVESLAHTIVKSAAEPKLDVYGGDKGFSAQRTATGIALQEHFFNHRTASRRTKHMPTTLLRLSDDYKVYTRKIDEIKLR